MFTGEVGRYYYNVTDEQLLTAASVALLETTAHIRRPGCTTSYQWCGIRVLYPFLLFTSCDIVPLMGGQCWFIHLCQTHAQSALRLDRRLSRLIRT